MYVSSSLFPLPFTKLTLHCSSDCLRLSNSSHGRLLNVRTRRSELYLAPSRLVRPLRLPPSVAELTLLRSLITATTSSITTSLAQSHCQTWYLTLRATSIIPSIVSSILHLLLFLLSLHYIHVRSNASLKVYIPKKNRKNKKKQMRQAKPISSNMPFVPSPHAPSMGGTPLTTPAMYYESSSPPVSSPDVSEDEKTPLPPPSYRSKKSSTSSSTKKSRPSPSSVPTPGPTPSLFGPPPAPPSEGDYPLSPRALSKGIPAGTSVFDLARRSEAGSTGSRRTREVAAYDSPRSASTRQEVQSDSGESEEGLSSGEEESVLSRRSSGHGRRDSRGGV